MVALFQQNQMLRTLEQEQSPRILRLSETRRAALLRDVVQPEATEERLYSLLSAYYMPLDQLREVAPKFNHYFQTYSEVEQLIVWGIHARLEEAGILAPRFGVGEGLLDAAIAGGACFGVILAAKAAGRDIKTDEDVLKCLAVAVTAGAKQKTKKTGKAPDPTAALAKDTRVSAPKKPGEKKQDNTLLYVVGILAAAGIILSVASK